MTTGNHGIEDEAGIGKRAIRASPVPLYLQIEQELRASIDSGELTPLAQVPSEAELSEQFSVSRMTARKALDRLVGEGMLFRQPGKGTFVSPPKIAHGPSQQLSFSEAVRSMGLAHETQVLEAGLVPAPRRVALSLGVSPTLPVVFMRRLRIVEQRPAAIHTSYLPVRFAPILRQDLTDSLTELMAGIGAHVDQSRDTLEAVTATGDEAELLTVPPGSPLVLIQGVAYTRGMPLRFTEALYRGDRFRFTVDPAARPNLRLEIKAEATHRPR